MFSKKRHIYIDGEGQWWTEGEDNANVLVVVTFPDASRWLCHFYTLKNIQSIREDMLRSGNRKYMWTSNPLVIVDTISRKHIEEVVDESIESGTFELLFEYFGAVTDHNREQVPAGFLSDGAKIESAEIVSRNAGVLYSMLEQSSESVKQTVKNWLFGDRDKMIEAWMLDYIVILEDRGIAAELERDKGRELREKWERLFARGLDAAARKEIYMDQFLWHLFSYRKLPCLAGREAEEAFDRLDKRECFIVYQNRDHALHVADASRLTADDLRGEQDVYVVDAGFTWTYANTHESDLGPYFYKR